MKKALCQEALISHDSTVEDNAGTICGDPGEREGVKMVE
jgi:hypothetical protein